MSTKTSFYIICPFYNSEKTIERAIQSIKQQTYSNWFLIMVDDGSTDSGYKIASKHEAESNNIIIITQDNKGAFFARKRAIDYLIEKRIQNGYVLFLDADDQFRSNTLSILNQRLNEFENLDFIYFNTDRIDENGVKKESYYSINEDMLLVSNIDICQKAIIENTYSSLGGACINISLILNNYSIPEKFRNTRVCEDYLVLSNMYLFSNKALFIIDSLYIYNINKCSTTNNISFYDWIDWLIIVSSINEMAVKKHNSLENKIPNNQLSIYIKHVINTLISIVHRTRRFKLFKRYSRVINKQYMFCLAANKGIAENEKTKKIIACLNKNKFFAAYLLILFDLIKKHLGS